MTGTTSGTVELLASSNGADPAPVAFTSVDGSGDASFTVKPTEKTTYFAQLQAGSKYASSSSSAVTVDVAPRLSVTARPLKAKSSRHSLDAVALTGVIVPARPAEPLIFSVARRDRGTWVPLPNVTARIHSSGKARMIFRPRRKGAYRVEVAFNGDSRYRGWVSVWTRFNVR